jgi:hypothetical protein
MKIQLNAINICLILLTIDGVIPVSDCLGRDPSA